MKLFTPNEVAQQTGLPYNKALALVKEMNYIQINNRYYVSEANLDAFFNSNTPVKISL